MNSLNEKAKIIKGLKWHPWIGDLYSLGGMLILGESQYEDGDFWQEDNTEATKTLVQKRLNGGKNRILQNTEKVIFSSNQILDTQIKSQWNSVIYYNLVQRLMSSRSERPNDKDFDFGWKVFFELWEILQPSLCIVLGKSSCGRLGYFLTHNDTKWNRNKSEFYTNEKVINLSRDNQKTQLIFINHPSGSRGFSFNKWSELIRKEQPEIENFLK